MAINSINPWGGLAWSSAFPSSCAGPTVAFGDRCAPSPDQLRFAMMRQLQWMESMLERLAGMLGGVQQQQQPLPCFGAGPTLPSGPAVACPGGSAFTGSSPQAPAPQAPAPAGPPAAANPGGSGMKAGAPPGYHTIKGAVPPGVTAKAKSLLNQPMGSEHSFEVDGKRYLARLEHHYHPPGYQGGPNGWHKGCSVYEAN